MYEWVRARECGLGRAAHSEHRHEQNELCAEYSLEYTADKARVVSVANEDMCALSSTSAWVVPGAEPLRVVVAHLGEDRLERKLSRSLACCGCGFFVKSRLLHYTA